MKTYDCIVLGTGGIGSAAAYFAARRGWSVLGLDRFPPAHARGSSHGRTRIIRQAYYEHPNYVPLALEAYRLWSELEQAANRKLVFQTGLLQVGDPDGDVVRGVSRSAREHQLPIERLTAEQVRQRWPVFNVPAGHVGLYETVAGYLPVETCVETMLSAAASLGAQLQHGVTVVGWSAENERCLVETDRETYSGRRLIICPGAWASNLVPGIGELLRVVRKHQHWFQIADERFALQAGFPTFLFETDDGFIYGFPQIDERGVKLAEHTRGETVEDPLSVDRSLDAEDLQRVQRFAAEYFNAPNPVHSDHSVCMYTMSPDEHFIVDMCDQHPPVAFACGMSGHGFKFAPVFGQYLVQLVDGQPRSDLDFLRSGRFANTLQSPESD